MESHVPPNFLREICFWLSEKEKKFPKDMQSAK